MANIGVLALQGDFAEHQAVLSNLGVLTTEVRLPPHLDGLDGLIIPGGETTTFARLLAFYSLASPIRDFALQGGPVWGTCAGLIAMASRIEGADDPLLGLLDVTVRRNAFGRQVDSFEADIQVPALGEAPFHAIFIRAPSITDAGPDVETLASLPDGRPVAVAQGHLLGTAFHPELTPDPRMHAYFLNVVERSRRTTDAAAR